jgi:superoxide dismutase, Cu-Zn family
MRTARGTPGSWLVAFAAANMLAWPAMAQQTPPPRAPQQPQHVHAPSIAAAWQQAEGSAMQDLRKRFEELIVRTTPASQRPGTKRKADMFDEFLAWPRNPLQVVLVVQFTSLTGVGHVIGTLTVKNSEIVVAGRKEAALFIEPDLRGLPQGLYAFHVHENPACGPAMKDGESVPGLQAGNHLWLSGTGAMTGTTFASHLGNLPNLTVEADGTAKKPVVAARLSLADVVRRAFVIHASQDDNSPRLACAAFD